MNSSSNSNARSEWTIKVTGEPSQESVLEQLINQFVTAIEAEGGHCQFNKSAMRSGMSLIQLDDSSASHAEKISEVMREHGMPEEQVARQIKLINAQSGNGRWDEVILDLEQDLAKLPPHSDDPNKKTGILLSLIEYSMNAGNKEKAKHYLDEVEAEFASIGDAIPKQQFGMYKGQLIKFRNWLT